VTFAWNADDVAKVFRSFFEPGIENYKYIDIPNTNYSSSNYDMIQKDGRTVGLSMFAGYSYNERSYLSLGTVDPDIADRRRADDDLGRGGRRHQEDHRGAAQADRDPREGLSRAVLARCAGNLRRGLAHQADGLASSTREGGR
jgi:hypothetical protein